MEINKLSTQLNGAVDSSKAADSQAAARANRVAKSDTAGDKVSLSKNGINTSENEFAKIELEKANTAAFSKLREYKARIKEYDEARTVSKEAAEQTELGRMLNDPEVWEKMAENMFR